MSHKESASYRRIVNRYKQALAHHSLIADGDRILIGLSGGKDSLCMTELLAGTMHIHRPQIRVEALHVRMDNIEYESDSSYLRDFCESRGVIYHEEHTRFDAETDTRKTPCFLCSWYRRKLLFNFAQAHGMNKIALGHHQDDILHTALLNLFYQGQFTSIRPKMKMDRMPLEIIRPMCMVYERDISEYAVEAGYEPQRVLCPHEHESERSNIRRVFEELETDNEEVRHSMWRALKREWEKSPEDC